MVEQPSSSRGQIQFELGGSRDTGGHGDTDSHPLASSFSSYQDRDASSTYRSSAATPQIVIPVQHLPVYTNLHRVRRDVVSVVEDYLSPEQLRDVRINIAVIRPLVDKLYGLNDISIVYCLLVNRAQFLDEQSHLHSRHNVNFTRAALCEIIATRILRRFGEGVNGTHEGDEGLLLLSHILVTGFQPFQNAPQSIQDQLVSGLSWAEKTSLPALEVAILTESKSFLSSTPCQKVIDAIYVGRITYTPIGFLEIIPDTYKQKPITIYNPREAPLLNQYRLIVPRTRNILEVLQFIVLLGLYLTFMAERDITQVSWIEVSFCVYAFGWSLDQFATILGHGWNVYTQNLWSFLDVAFIVLYGVYLLFRVHSHLWDDRVAAQQAMDVLAISAPVLIPRLAFNLLSDHLVFLSLRSMMSDFAMLTVLSAWCFAGFFLSLLWLGDGMHQPVLISEWMLWIWFGLDGTGIDRSTEFHPLLGPALMVAFAFLGNTLFLTILVSMLSHTFSTIVANATAEIQFRKAVLTLECVKSDAISAYLPPFNIFAIFFLLPLKFVVGPRWFHKIHVASVRLINLPLLLLIAIAERRLLPSGEEDEKRDRICLPDPLPEPLSLQESSSTLAYLVTVPLGTLARVQAWFRSRWRLHRDICAAFDLPPPESVEQEIRADDELTSHLIRRQFAPPSAHSSAHSSQSPHLHPQAGTTTPSLPHKGVGGGSGGSGDDVRMSLKHPPLAVLPPPASADAQQQQQQQNTTGHSRNPSFSHQSVSASPSATTSSFANRSSQNRRDSTFAGLSQRVRQTFADSDLLQDVTERLDAVEGTLARIEQLLVQQMEEKQAQQAQDVEDFLLEPEAIHKSPSLLGD